MRNKKFGFLSVLLIIGLGSSIFLANSCQNEGIPATQFEQICFTEQVLPIFQNSCATSGCHDSKGEGGYEFSSYNNIMEAVTPGNADNSKAYQAMTSTFKLMPPDNPLSENNRTIIRLWIEQGATETTCGTTKSAGTN